MYIFDREMRYCNVKIHQNTFSAGLHPAPLGIAYSTLSDPLAGLTGAISREMRGREGTKWKKKEVLL